MKPKTNTTWRTVRLGDLITVKHGFAFEGKHFSQSPTENILLTPGNFQIGGGYKDEKLKYYDGPIPSGYVLSSGDLIVTMTDLSKSGDTLGYSALVPSGKEQKFLHNQRIGLVEKKSHTVNLHFLYYLLWTKQYHHHIMGTATGSTIRHTAPERIQNFEFLLPPMGEQKCIAEILSAFDEKIENNNRTIKTLEEMAQAIFKEWFAVPSGALVKDGQLPKEWRARTLGDLGKIITGKTPSIKDRENFGDDYPFITIPDLQNGVFVIRTERFLSEQGAETMRASKLPAGAICVSCIATVGLVAIATRESFTNQQINSIIPSSPVLQPFIFLLLRRMKNGLQAYASGGTAAPIISKSAFEKVGILIPPENLLEDFCEIISPMFEKIKNVLEENQKLAAMRDLLLPRLMSGEIKI